MMGDGEREQAIYWSDRVLIEQLWQLNIDLLKLPAGLSFLYQANDVGKTHTLIKQGARNAWNAPVDSSTIQSFDQEWNRIKKLCKEGKVRPEDPEASQIKVQLSSDTGTRCKTAVRLLHIPFRNVLTPKNITKGFQEAGLSMEVSKQKTKYEENPSDTARQDWYPDTERIMQRCPNWMALKSQASKHILAQIEACGSPDSDLVDKYTEAEMDEMQIKTTKESRERETSSSKKNRDDMVLYYQRTVLLTAPNFLERRAKEEEARRQAAAKKAKDDAKAEKDAAYKKRLKSAALLYKKALKASKDFANSFKQANSHKSKALPGNGDINADQCHTCGVWKGHLEEQGLESLKDRNNKTIEWKTCMQCSRPFCLMCVIEKRLNVHQSSCIVEKFQVTAMKPKRKKKKKTK